MDKANGTKQVRDETLQETLEIGVASRDNNRTEMSKPIGRTEKLSTTAHNKEIGTYCGNAQR